MNREQRRAQRNEIVVQLIKILQTYDDTYGDCNFDEDLQVGVVSFCSTRVSRRVIRDMEEIGLKIYHIYFSNFEHCYKISFKYEYHD